MSLGLAEEQLARDPDGARAVAGRGARGQQRGAGRVARSRAGHPSAGAGRPGLVGAVQALALAAPMPVEVQAELPGRLPAPVESAAYFAVAEALTNVVKHSAAGTPVRLSRR